jgi:hypothetical protein
MTESQPPLVDSPVSPQKFEKYLWFDVAMLFVSTNY